MLLNTRGGNINATNQLSTYTVGGKTNRKHQVVIGIPFLRINHQISFGSDQNLQTVGVVKPIENI